MARAVLATALLAAGWLRFDQHRELAGRSVALAAVAFAIAFATTVSEQVVDEMFSRKKSPDDRATLQADVQRAWRARWAADQKAGVARFVLRRIRGTTFILYLLAVLAVPITLTTAFESAALPSFLVMLLVCAALGAIISMPLGIRAWRRGLAGVAKYDREHAA